MFRNGKTVLMNKPLLSAEEVIRGFDAVTMDDIERIKPLICDFSQYSAVAVTNRKVSLKEIMRG